MLSPCWPIETFMRKQQYLSHRSNKHTRDAWSVKQHGSIKITIFNSYSMYLWDKTMHKSSLSFVFLSNVFDYLFLT